MRGRVDRCPLALLSIDRIAAAGDANDSGTINVADAAYSLNFLFRGGMIPPPPFPNPGLDPSDDQLGCDD